MHSINDDLALLDGKRRCSDQDKLQTLISYPSTYKVRKFTVAQDPQIHLMLRLGCNLWKVKRSTEETSDHYILTLVESQHPMFAIPMNKYFDNFVRDDLASSVYDMRTRQTFIECLKTNCQWRKFGFKQSDICLALNSVERTFADLAELWLATKTTDDYPIAPLMFACQQYRIRKKQQQSTNTSSSASSSASKFHEDMKESAFVFFDKPFDKWTMREYCELMTTWHREWFTSVGDEYAAEGTRALWWIHLAEPRLSAFYIHLVLLSHGRTDVFHTCLMQCQEMSSLYRFVECEVIVTFSLPSFLPETSEKLVFRAAIAGRVKTVTETLAKNGCAINDSFVHLLVAEVKHLCFTVPGCDDFQVLPFALNTGFAEKHKDLLTELVDRFYILFLKRARYLTRFIRRRSDYGKHIVRLLRGTMVEDKLVALCKSLMEDDGVKD